MRVIGAGATRRRGSGRQPHAQSACRSTASRASECSHHEGLLRVQRPPPCLRPGLP